MKLHNVLIGALSEGRTFGRLSILMLLLLAPACAGSGGENAASGEAATEGDQPSPWPGCYTLTADAEDWRLPAGVALDTVPLQGWNAFVERRGQVFQARSFRDGRFRDTPFAYWRPLEGDSVTLGHPGALAGVTLRIGRGEEGPSGRALAFTDAVEPGESGRDSTGVRLAPVSCDSLGSGSAGDSS